MFYFFPRQVLLKTDSCWLMKSEASRDKPTIPCFLLFIIHVQQQELGGFTLPSDMYKWTKMRYMVLISLRSKRFQSSYYAKVRAEAKKRLKGEGEGRRGFLRSPPPPPSFIIFLLLSRLSRRTSRGNACYAG